MTGLCRLFNQLRHVLALLGGRVVDDGESI